MAAKGGGESLVKSNISSSDNPLAFPVQSTTPHLYHNNNNNNQIDQINRSPPMIQQQQQQQQTNFNLNGYRSAPKSIAPELWIRKEVQNSNDTIINNVNLNPNYLTKQNYRQDLDKQILDKIERANQEKNRNYNNNNNYSYPFGSNNTTNISTDYSTGYKTASYRQNTVGFNDNNRPKYHKDNIIEKPNSMSASEIPPYDPIKYKNFIPDQVYDPWGKPGGGAPMVDPLTGKKYTKTSGQVWYDKIGINPDDRYEMFRSKAKPQTLAEQQNEMEEERQRRHWEAEELKTRPNDVASWIIQKRRAEQARLQHSNVTREKINTETARKLKIDESTKLYHDVLSEQVEDNDRRNRLNKLNDDVAGIEHTKSWDSWVTIKIKSIFYFKNVECLNFYKIKKWGRPGAGAPNSDIRRHNTQGVIQSDTRDQTYATSNGSYGKQVNSGYSSGPPQVLTRQIGDSNHKNLYESFLAMRE
jgi:hypothetical protein